MGKFLTLAFITLLCLCTHLSFAQVKSAPIPGWVRTVDPRSTSAQIKEEGSFFYELIERQFHLAEKAIFSRQRIKVLTVDGIQQNSDISIDFDPSYQSLTIHEIKLIRAGKEINKLDLQKIKLIQQEDGAMQYIYDGTQSAILHLTDVQKQDVIEYSYSLKGFNPVNKDHFSAWLVHQFYLPVGQFRYVLIADEHTTIHSSQFRHEYQPKVVSQAGQKVYTWENQAVDALDFDTNIPMWDAMYPMTTVSTFSDWKDVVQWALPLYEYSALEARALAAPFLQGDDKAENIQKMIRSVQDDIRYLGLESGMSAYMPNPPEKVWERKFGDCKDKSLLLAAMMREAGVEAYPMLVNTEWRHKSNLLHPSQIAFDHCVVAFEWEGQNHYVDPTFAYQGGTLDKIYFPDYGLGLIIKPGETKLTELPKNQVSSTSISELITVKDFGGKAEFVVRSEFKGKKADETRGLFANGIKEEINTDYLNYYSNLYPGISSTADIKVMDHGRNHDNIFIVEEYYEIPEFWTKSDDSTQLYGEVYPLVLESLLELAPSAKRSSDYYLGEPEEFFQSTQLVLPSKWSFTPETKSVDAGVFQYNNQIKGSGNTIIIEHSFKRLQNSVAADKLAEVIKKKDQVRGELSLMVYHQNPSGPKGGLHILAAGLCCILLGVGIYFGRKFYRSYDPDPWVYAENKPIGGWLILPAIGLFATPIVVLLQIFETGFFTDTLWKNIEMHGFWLRFFVVGELTYNLFYFIFTMLLIVFFLQRRTGTPKLMIAFLVVSFVGVTLDSSISAIFFPEIGSDIESNTIIRSFVGMAVWVPYFSVSERVKSTFCKTYRPRD